MRNNPEIEMRDEYDFSGGVRGRHAAHMTAQDRDDLHRRAAAQDVQTWIAHSLLQVQAFEAALFAYFVLAENDSPEQAGKQAAALFESQELQSLNQLLAGLCDRGISDEGLEDRLARLIDERNWLVHRSGYESQTASPPSEQTLSRLTRLERSSDEARALKVRFDDLVKAHLANNGLSKHEIDKKTDEAANLWLAA